MLCVFRSVQNVSLRYFAATWMHIIRRERTLKRQRRRPFTLLRPSSSVFRVVRVSGCLCVCACLSLHNPPPLSSLQPIWFAIRKRWGSTGQRRYRSRQAASTSTPAKLPSARHCSPILASAHLQAALTRCPPDRRACPAPTPGAGRGTGCGRGGGRARGGGGRCQSGAREMARG